MRMRAQSYGRFGAGGRYAAGKERKADFDRFDRIVRCGRASPGSKTAGVIRLREILDREARQRLYFGQQLACGNTVVAVVRDDRESTPRLALEKWRARDGRRQHRL